MACIDNYTHLNIYYSYFGKEHLFFSISAHLGLKVYNRNMIQYFIIGYKSKQKKIQSTKALQQSHYSELNNNEACTQKSKFDRTFAKTLKTVSVACV